MNVDIYKFGEKFNLTESEELALKYIVNNIGKSLEIGVRGVAKECFASTSVVMNLSKKLGYKGFIDMVYRLELELKSTFSEKNNTEDFCINFSIQKGLKFKKLLNTIKNKAIFVHGAGFSRAISRYISDKLMVLGYFSMMSEYMESVDKIYEDKPLLILVSKSGETSAILNLCQKAKLKNIPIISFTGIKNSSLEKFSDINFLVKNSNPLDDRNLEKNDFFANTILFFEELIEQYSK